MEFKWNLDCRGKPESWSLNMSATIGSWLSCNEKKVGSGERVSPEFVNLVLNLSEDIVKEYFLYD